MKTKSIICGTGNPGKQREFSEILTPLGIALEAPPDIDVEETGHTFEQNALLKARAIAGHSGLVAVSEDAGLVVPVLNNWPGLYSARFANCQLEGHGKSLQIRSHELRNDRKPLQGKALEVENNRLLLEHLSGLTGNDRQAYFYLYLAVSAPNGDILFTAEGRCNGYIAEEVRIGTDGFAYDQVFIGNETNGLHYSELRPEVKNSISHRGQALTKFAAWAKEWEG